MSHHQYCEWFSGSICCLRHAVFCIFPPGLRFVNYLARVPYHYPLHFYAKDNSSPKYRFSKHFGPGRENIFGEMTSAWNYVVIMCLLACCSFYSNKSIINRFIETLQQLISSTKRRLTFALMFVCRKLTLVFTIVN